MAGWGKNSDNQWRQKAMRLAPNYGVDPNLVDYIMYTESRGNPRAVSSAGATGLMQLMPGTAKQYGVKDSFDPDQNIAGSLKLLDHLTRKYKGDPKLIMAAYNAGEGNVAKHGGVPPFKETQKYVAGWDKWNKGNGGTNPMLPNQVNAPGMVIDPNAQPPATVSQAQVAPQGQQMPQEMSLGQQMATNPFLQMGLGILSTNNLGGAAQGLQAATQAENLVAQQHWRNRNQAQSQAGYGSKDNRTAVEKQWDRYQQILQTAGPEAAEKFLEFANVYDNPENAREVAQAREGGKTGFTRVEQRYNNLVKLRNFGGKIDMLEDKLVRLHGLTDSSSTGIASWLKMLPTVPANEWANLKESVVSSLALDELKQLKQESAQGASGLGALNEKELQVLVTSVENLSQTNSPEVIRHNIENIMEAYLKLREQTQQSYQENKHMYNAMNPELGQDKFHHVPKPDLYDYFQDKTQGVKKLLEAGPQNMPQPQQPSSGGSGGFRFIGVE